MEELLQILERLPFWDKLTDEERAYAIRNSAVRRAERGSLLYSRDCACVGLVYVITGGLRIYLLSPEGREITLFRLGENEPCVLSASCVVKQISFDTHLSAERDSKLLVMNAEAFAKLTSSNVYVRCFLFEQASENFSAVMKTMENMLFSRFDSRLASYLIGEYVRTGEALIPVTQSAIAERVNSAREVVARMLKQFAAEGLVETRRGGVLIVDAEGLKTKIQ